MENDNEKLKIDKKIVVFYHGDCQDGFSAAWSAWKSFGEQADYVPVFNGDPFPLEVKDKEVFFVDVLPVDEVFKNIIANNLSVTAIDHHSTNAIKIKLATHHVFDISKSGAVLAWEFFHLDVPVPLLLQYVQDMDLWKWKLPDSEAIASYIGTTDFSFDIWTSLCKDL